GRSSIAMPTPSPRHDRPNRWFKSSQNVAFERLRSDALDGTARSPLGSLAAAEPRTVTRGAGRVRRSGTSGLSERSERGKRSAEPGPTSAAPLEEPSHRVFERRRSRGDGATARETERSRSEF